MDRPVGEPGLRIKPSSIGRLQFETPERNIKSHLWFQILTTWQVMAVSAVYGEPDICEKSCWQNQFVNKSLSEWWNTITKIEISETHWGKAGSPNSAQCYSSNFKIFIATKKHYNQQEPTDNHWQKYHTQSGRKHCCWFLSSSQISKGWIPHASLMIALGLLPCQHQEHGGAHDGRSDAAESSDLMCCGLQNWSRNEVAWKHQLGERLIRASE